ncbi:hypothetical protein MMC08_008765, partial [Hypocenomyce scalaris]|nr:hypothetical protein [Hypocenomyce scalaris]
MRQTYWNEYDDGSEAENEPYTLYVNPDPEATYPGAKAVMYILDHAKTPIEKMKSWFQPITSPGERQSLLGNGHNSQSERFAEQTETDIDEAYASSTDFPGGYAAHYATFHSIKDQKLSRAHEQLLFHSMIGSFITASLLLLIAGILIATGQHRLRIEVDAGAIVGVVSSLFFGTLGFGIMLARQEN